MMVTFGFNRLNVLAFSGVDDFGNEFALAFRQESAPLAPLPDHPIAIETFHLPSRVLVSAMMFCEVNGDEAIH